MEFRQKMKLYDKESLKDFAAELGLSKVSQLRKAELIERIAEEFLNPQKLFYRLAVLNDDALELWQNASEGSLPIAPRDRAFDTAFTLDRMEIAEFYEASELRTLTDVWEIYEKEIDGATFEAYRAKALWVWKCLCWAEGMYITTPEDIFLKVVNKKKNMRVTAGELREIFDNFPPDCKNVLRIDNFYIDSEYAYNLNALAAIHARQADKDYYIPSIAEVEEFFETGALLSHKPYQDMLRFLTGDMKMKRDEAEDLLYETWIRSASDESPTKTMQWLFGELVFDGEEQLNKAVQLFTNLSNATNLPINRGYAPADMPHQALKPGQMPKIVPGSKAMAKMLKEGLPEIRDLGFDVDFAAGEALQKEREKVGCNDPCPYGSGKKCKKCCGR